MGGDAVLASIGELVVSRATEDDRAAFLASVDGLFHEDAAVHDPYGDRDWTVRGGAAYFTDLLGDPRAVPLLAREGDRAFGHLVGRVLEPDTLRTGTRTAVLESIRRAVRAGVTAYAANEAAQRFYARHGFVPASVMLRTTL